MKILLAALALTAAVAVAQEQQPQTQQTIDHVSDEDVITLDNGDSYEALDPKVRTGRKATR